MANKFSDLKGLSTPEMEARRAQLAAAVADPETTLRGSLLSQGRRCGRPGCHCAEGELHGPYTYLSVGRGVAGARLLYVPAGLAEVVRYRVELTEAAEEALAEISAINLELLARRELR
ncbi:MAG TPA: DUF6788 family protein [Actinomycetota bacterium]|nr:DUF6788 family protein [Actinomycetota bacterium]